MLIWTVARVRLALGMAMIAAGFAGLHKALRKAQGISESNRDS
jgi:hypothetical protein